MNFRHFHTTVIILALIDAASGSFDSVSSELWINTTYQAEDLGIRYDALPQCKAWNLWWELQHGEIEPTEEIVDLLASRKKLVSLSSVAQLLKFGLPKHILSKYKTVHISFEEVCKNHSRYLLIDSSATAKQYKLNLSKICSNYAVRKKSSMNKEANVERDSTSTEYHRELVFSEAESNKPSISFIAEYKPENNLQRTDSSLLIESGIRIINPRAKITYQVNADTDKKSSAVVIQNQNVANFFELGETSAIFRLHKALQIDLKKACVVGQKAKPKPDSNVDWILASLQDVDEKKEDEEKAKMNLTAEEKLSTLTVLFKRGIHLSSILHLFDSGILSDLVPLSSSVLIPFLEKTHYDSRSPPVNLKSKATEVLFGIFVQSMSNFEQSTMDYDMDVWLRMTWRDLRLAHQFDRPILINDENILKKIWRPAPFFQNAKEAEYHRVTAMNFWIYIFPGGEVFFETHLYLKPACKLILCKYPHDNQVCSLKISDIASAEDSVRYSWFPRLSDAIRMNKNTDLEELYVAKYYKKLCNGARKTGNYSCLEARYLLKRRLGYHMARTYIPTATCVVFSWISVWLPEEFVTGRIFSSLTLFLTLSAESSAVKEVLPKVSYMKAIDLWFGFTASFVFITMLEALTVIMLEHKSLQLRKKVIANLDDMSQYQMMLLMLESGRYHSVARRIDNYCRTLYPVIFLLFLIIYYFVITEGVETKCLQRSHDEL